MGQPDLTDEGLGQLVERVRAAAGALMQGEARRYFELVDEASWRLVHRHADALVQPIGMAQLSQLARGAADAG